MFKFSQKQQNKLPTQLSIILICIIIITFVRSQVNFLLDALHDKNVLGDTVSTAFLKAFIYILGGYRQAFR